MRESAQQQMAEVRGNAQGSSRTGIDHVQKPLNEEEWKMQEAWRMIQEAARQQE